MQKKIVLSKSDVIISLACVFVLLMTLGAVGSRGRRLARFVVCQSNLKLQQEAQIQFWQDNYGQMTPYSFWTLWWASINDYLGDYADRVRFCPEADDVIEYAGFGGIYEGWIFFETTGSYGFNGWLYDEDSMVGGPLFLHLSAVSEPELTPVFLDSFWVDSWPMNDVDLPPEDWTDHWEVPYPSDNMHRFLVNRHDLRDNVSFVDGHVEPVHFTDLWTLYWHLGSEPNYDVVVPW